MTDLYGEIMGIFIDKKKKGEALKSLTPNKIKYQIILSNKPLNKEGLSTPGLVDSKWEICLGGARPSQQGSRV